MKLRLIVLLLASFLVGCINNQATYRMTSSGYLVSTPPLTSHCNHFKEAIYEYRYVSPPALSSSMAFGIDEEGQNIYRRLPIVGGYYDKSLVGYRCYLCGINL